MCLSDTWWDPFKSSKFGMIVFDIGHVWVAVYKIKGLRYRTLKCKLQSSRSCWANLTKTKLWQFEFENKVDNSIDIGALFRSLDVGWRLSRRHVERTICKEFAKCEDCELPSAGQWSSGGESEFKALDCKAFYDQKAIQTLDSKAFYKHRAIKN